MNKPEDVLLLMQNNHHLILVLVRMVAFEHGIKLIKLFKELYKHNQECLFSEEIRVGLT